MNNNSILMFVDDPFWEAVDLQYWPTLDIEWYDPGQVTTQGGSLVLNMVEVSKNSFMHRSSPEQMTRKRTII